MKKEVIRVNQQLLRLKEVVEEELRSIGEAEIVHSRTNVAADKEE